MSDSRIFELRTYYAEADRLGDLERRFTDHTVALFAQHEIEVLAFWRPTDGPGADSTLVYLLAFPDRVAADTSWEAFRADPDWQRAKDASEVDGPLVARIESVFLAPTAYSPLR